MRTRVPGILIALIVTATIVLGCGGDDETTSSTAAEPSAGSTTPSYGSDFAVQANAICAEGEDEINAAAEETLPSNPNTEDFNSFSVETVVPRTQDTIDQLSELEPPPEGAEEWAAILEEVQAANDELAANPESLDGPDPFFTVNEQLSDTFRIVECG